MLTHLVKRLEANTTLHPNKPAFIYKRKNQDWDTLTYGQFWELVKRMENGLINLGISPMTKAVLMAPPDVSFFALAFALLKSGVTPVIIDPAIGLNNVTLCLRETQPDIFIGNAFTHGLRLLYGWGKPGLKKNLSTQRILSAGANAAQRDSSPVEALADAAIIFTSGSTGLPKGAIYTHGNLLAQIDMLVKSLHLSGEEIDLPAFPIFALIDLLLGVTSIIPDIRFPWPAKADPSLMIEAIQTYRVDTLFASPVVLERIARFTENRPTRMTSLKRVITAGAPAPVAVLENFLNCLTPETKIYGIYGSTEALPITLIDCKEILDETRFATQTGAGICIGKTVDGMHIEIIPITDNALANNSEIVKNLPTGTTGEIMVEGAAVTAAYAGSPQHNTLAKVQDSQGLIHHRMGDLGYFDELGRLWYCGRKSHRVLTSTGVLFSERVEGIFNAHPEVYRTALVGVPINGQTRPVLWVELKRRSTPNDQGKIRQELLRMGASFEMTRDIRDILFHRSFPTDVRHNSKIIREKLADLAQKRLR